MKSFKLEKAVKNAYNFIADDFNSTRLNSGRFYNEYLEMPTTLRLMGDIKGKRIIDIGCGTGIYAKRMENLGAEVHGIDISDKEIEIAKRSYPEIDFRVGSVSDMPYKSGSFDMALVALAFTHFDDSDKAMKEIRRVLKMHGMLIISEGNPVITATRRINGEPDNHRIFENYFSDSVKYSNWHRGFKKKISMPYRHITYESYFSLFRKYGFALSGYADARPVPNGKRIDPESYAFTSKVPYFLTFKLIKLSKAEARMIFGNQ